MLRRSFVAAAGLAAVAAPFLARPASAEAAEIIGAGSTLPQPIYEAWAMTSSRFQAQQDREQWERFWEGHDVEVVGDPQVDGDTVVVPITYDGQREDYRLDVVRQGGGWLVDGPVGG